VTLPCASFSDVVKQLYQLYGNENIYHPELRIQYVDAEGDKVTVNSQEEWEELFGAVGNSRPIKLYVSDTPQKGRYFKDGPPPETLYFYTKDKDEKVTKICGGKSLEALEGGLPSCLGRFFPGGKILPFNLPSWLKSSGCLTFKTVPNGPVVDVVDIDVDVGKLLRVLHDQSLVYLDANSSVEQLKLAKEFLFALLELSPTNSSALYNLACAEALLRNEKEAVDALQRAVEIGGFSNLEHMCTDTDLDSIRDCEAYAKIVAKLKEKLGIQEEKEEDEEEEEEEEEEEKEIKNGSDGRSEGEMGK